VPWRTFLGHNGGSISRLFSTIAAAGGHCEPLAQAVREAHIFDWLEEHLG
jgi:hypothetical protein